jgi:hypothetical protein
VILEGIGNVRTLCEMIDMPEEVTQEIEKWNAEEYREALEHYFFMIREKVQWDTALEEVKQLLKEDKNGLNCLAFMMHVSLRSYQEYRIKRISEQIYLDTMGCFSRFVKEYKESYGTYGFDREWWTVRELSLKEFRLGELEYELTGEDNNQFVSVHIPSDAKLEKQKCLDSYKKAKSFLLEHVHEYTDVAFYCESWLLSSKLKELLSEDSNIIRFQSDFIIDTVETEDTGYMKWVFKNDTLSLNEVPQTTSLQRKMKAYLQSGGKIGVRRGQIRQELFQ